MLQCITIKCVVVEYTILMFVSICQEVQHTLVFTNLVSYCMISFTHQRLKSIQTVTEGVQNITISADCDAPCKGPVLDPGGASSQVGGQPGVGWGSGWEGHA